MGGGQSLVDTLLNGGGWFVSCIMLYYIAFFFIRKYLIRYLYHVLIGTLLISFCLYPLFCTGDDFSIYGNTFFKWIFFFSSMLVGAITGRQIMGRNTLPDHTSHAHFCWNDLFKMIACVVAFYGCFYLKNTSLDWLQCLSIIPLLGIPCCLYKICDAEVFKRLYYKKISGTVIRLIGGLCLEIYIVQGALFTTSLNSLFPLNLFIIFVEIVAWAYVLRCLARIWTQTFQNEDYNWKLIFTI
jgi:hypothetical protein